MDVIKDDLSRRSDDVDGVQNSIDQVTSKVDLMGSRLKEIEAEVHSHDQSDFEQWLKEVKVILQNELHQSIQDSHQAWTEINQKLKDCESTLSAKFLSLSESITDFESRVSYTESLEDWVQHIECRFQESLKCQGHDSFVDDAEQRLDRVES